MKYNHIIKKLLKGVSLSPCDLARLALEVIESLGNLAQGLNRLELITLLRNTLQSGVAAMKASTHTVSLKEAAWASIEARQDLRPTSRRDLRHFIRRLLNVEGVAALPLRSITTAQCRQMLTAAFASSRSSFIKGRAILHSVFSFGIRQEWCDANPVTKIEVPKIKEKHIEPLTLTEVKKLEATTKREGFRDMQFSLSLMLYGGIRPAEVSRLQERDFDWENHQVIIRPNTSKTGGGRTVPLRGIRGIKAKERIIPRNWKRKWRDLRRAAGYRGRSWIPDICRHTFATYHAAHFRNLPQLQLEMGHRNASLLMTRYMVPALRKDATSFWENAGCLKTGLLC